MRIRLMLTEANLYGLGLHKDVIDDIKSKRDSDTKGTDNAIFAILNWFKNEPSSMLKDSSGRQVDGTDYNKNYRSSLRVAKKQIRSGDREEGSRILELTNALFVENFNEWFDKLDLVDIYNAMSSSPSVNKVYSHYDNAMLALEKSEEENNRENSVKRLEAENGLTWVDLETNFSHEEKKANDHCGKAVYNDSTLISLRKDVTIPGKILVEYNKKRNTLVQIGQEKNEIPDKEYWSSIRLLYNRLGKPKIDGGFFYSTPDLTLSIDFLMSIVGDKLERVPWVLWQKSITGNNAANGGTPSRVSDRRRLLDFLKKKSSTDDKYKELFIKIKKDGQLNDLYDGDNSETARKNILRDSPKDAYRIAEREGPNDDTRDSVLREKNLAYKYALNIDKGPRDDTRSAILSSPSLSLSYAKNIDKKPRGDTKEAALKSDFFGHRYEEWELQFNN